MVRRPTQVKTSLKQWTFNLCMTRHLYIVFISAFNLLPINSKYFIICGSFLTKRSLCLFRCGSLPAVAKFKLFDTTASQVISSVDWFKSVNCYTPGRLMKFTEHDRNNEVAESTFPISLGAECGERQKTNKCHCVANEYMTAYLIYTKWVTIISITERSACVTGCGIRWVS